MFTVSDFSVETLLRTPLDQLGLEPHSESEWMYRSRAYKLLQWTIQPVLRCAVERSSAGLTLCCQHVEVQGLGGLADWVRVKAGANITRAPTGMTVLHWLELAIQAHGGLQLVPRSLLEGGMLQALDLSNKRLGRTLHRKVSKLLEHEEVSHDKPLPKYPTN